MRRFAIVTMAAAMAMTAAACGSSSKSSEGGSSNTTAAAPGTTAATVPISCSGGSSAYETTIGTASDFKPVTADTLTVVTSLPGPGFWEGSDTDPAAINSGFEFDIAKKMQAAFGMSKLVVRNENFDSITAGTITDYDVSLSQISITCDRAKVAKFSIPYFQSQQGVLIKKGGPSVTTLDEAKSIQWGVQASTTAIDLLDQVKPTKDPKIYQQLPDAYTALEAGQIDAVLIDTAINLGEAARSNGKFEVVSQFAQPSGPDQYGAILPKNSTNAGAINAVIKQLIDSGELNTLAQQDLTTDPGTLPVINAS